MYNRTTWTGFYNNPKWYQVAGKNKINPLDKFFDEDEDEIDYNYKA